VLVQIVQERTVFNTVYTPRKIGEAEARRLDELSVTLFKKLAEARLQDNKYKNMQVQRKRLPAYLTKEMIIEQVKKNQVILISGATGSGKTTQVAFVQKCGYHETAKELILIPTTVNLYWMT